jgi:sensor histidine kinase regulating citrate/malate metabolism
VCLNFFITKTKKEKQNPLQVILHDFTSLQLAGCLLGETSGVKDGEKATQERCPTWI